jgi:phosphoribosylpyrophosphate synthetase
MTPSAQNTATAEQQPQLQPAELATLQLVCETLIAMDKHGETPQDFFARSANDLHIAEKLSQRLNDVADPALVRELRIFLRTLEVPFFNALFAARGLPFVEMNTAERVSALRTWQNSLFGFRRKLFQVLKRLALWLFYEADENGQNPNWAALGFAPAPEAKLKAEFSFTPLQIDQDTTLYTDVVVVGSAEGGSVVAAQLAAAGHDVIILNQHQQSESAPLPPTTHDQSIQLFDSRYPLASTHNLVAPDERIRAEWATRYGLTICSSAEFQVMLNNTVAQLGARQTDELASQAAILQRAAMAHNHSLSPLPQMSPGQKVAGFYLREAQSRGARLFSDLHVDHVLIKRGRVMGVQANFVRPDGQQHQVTIQARAVVAAGGPLRTPALLLRSGLSNANIGQNLHLHPATIVYGVYDEAVRGWAAPAMTHQVALGGKSHNFSLTTGPIQPKLAAMILPWASSRQHKQLMERLPNMAAFLVITRDRDGGQVKLNRQQQPVVKYSLTEHDRQQLQAGMIEAIRSHAAAGAREIIAPFAAPMIFYPARNDLNRYIEHVANIRPRSNYISLLSPYQSSSCRSGLNSADGAIAPNGETLEVKGLYVADASLLPTAPGVDPTLSVLALAQAIAGNVQSAL